MKKSSNKSQSHSALGEQRSLRERRHLHMRHLAQPLKGANIPPGNERFAVSQSMDLGQCQHMRNHLPTLETEVLWGLAVTPQRALLPRQRIHFPGMTWNRILLTQHHLTPDFPSFSRHSQSQARGLLSEVKKPTKYKPKLQKELVKPFPYIPTLA